MSEELNVMGRRSFIASMAVAAGAVGLTEATTPAMAAEGQRTSFEAWLDSIPGKHRQVYDAPSPHNGFPLIWSHVFLMTGVEGYDVPESELGVVLVLRHSAIPIAFNDSVWAKYKLGEYFKIDDPATKAPATRNPFAYIKPGDLPLPEAALEKLLARNVRVGVCHTAIHFQSMRMAQMAGVAHDVVKNDLLAAVIPGVQVVPSGVLAVNGAQARGCSYCFAG